MDFNALTSYFVPVVAIACLILGYIFKHASLFKFIPNDDIPCISRWHFEPDRYWIIIPELHIGRFNGISFYWYASGI